MWRLGLPSLGIAACCTEQNLRTEKKKSLFQESIFPAAAASFAMLDEKGWFKALPSSAFITWWSGSLF